jgi:glycosyltransferase involved in cell wall biosynthesis
MTTEKKKLWIISELYYPEDNTTGYYMTRLAEGLARSSDVAVICGQPNYHRRGQKARSQERRKGVEINRVWSTTLDKNVALFKVVNMMTLTVSVFVSALRRFAKGDRVLVVTAPPTLLFAAGAASLAKGASYTLLIHDNYPEMLVAAGVLRSGSGFVWLYEFCNRWLYKYANRVIVVGRDMAAIAERKVAGLDVPVRVIPNWAETEQVHPTRRDSNPLLRELGIIDKFVVLYAGNMGHPQDLESVWEASRLLAGEDEIHFLLIGSGTKRKWLEQQIEEHSPSNVTLLPPKPRTEQNVFLNACDVAIVSLIPGMLGVSVPSRIYNYCAAGKPILGITDEGSEIAMMIDEGGVGMNVPPRRPDLVRDAIRNLSVDRSRAARMGTAALQLALNGYDEESAIERYREVLLG